MGNQNKKKMIVIASIGGVVFVILLFCILFFVTDLGKSPQQLFYKYLPQNEQLVEFLSSDFNAAYEQKKKQSSYAVEGELSVTLTADEEENGIGTATLSAETALEQMESNEITGELFRVLTEEKVDQENQNKSYTARVTKNNKELASAKYLKTGNLYALGSDQVVNKYIAIDETRQKELFAKLSTISFSNLLTATEENQTENSQSQQIDVGTNQITILPSILQHVLAGEIHFETIRFTESEKEVIQKEYISFISEKTNKSKFTKNSANITVDGTSVKAKQYTLTTTTQEVKDLAVQILQHMQSDTQTLNIIVNKYNTAVPNDPITTNDLIQVIQQIARTVYENDTENQQLQISLYVVNNQLVKTEITTEENVFAIQYIKGATETKIILQSETGIIQNFNAMELRKSENENQSAFTIILSDSVNSRHSVTLQSSKVGNVNSSTIKNLNILTIKEDETKYTIRYSDNINFGNQVEVETLNSDNSITLNDYPSQELESLVTAILQRTVQVYQETANKIMSGDFESEEQEENLPEQNEQQEGEGSNENNKLAIDMFNEQFLAYLGDQVQAEEVQQLMETVKTAVQNQNEIKVNFTGTYNGTTIEKEATTIEEFEALKAYMVSGKNYNTQGLADTTGKLIEVTIRENVDNT